MVVRCTEACLALARSLRPRLVLVPAVPHVLAPRGLSQIYKYETPIINEMYGMQSIICCMIMSTLTVLTLTSYLLNYP
jgi:hypothetical protein